MKPFTRILTLGAVIVIAPAVGYTLMQFAGFLEFDCHQHPLNNPRCWEKDVYACAGLASFGLATTALCAAAANWACRKTAAKQRAS